MLLCCRFPAILADLVVRRFSRGSPRIQERFPPGLRSRRDLGRVVGDRSRGSLVLCRKRCAVKLAPRLGGGRAGAFVLRSVAIVGLAGAGCVPAVLVGLGEPLRLSLVLLAGCCTAAPVGARGWGTGPGQARN